MDGHRYLPSTAVFLNEVIKLAVSLSIALYDISQTLPLSTPATVLFEQLYASVFFGDGWKLAIPAVLYTFQNSLQYIAVSNLDAVHFQILYQLKVRSRWPVMKVLRLNNRRSSRQPSSALRCSEGLYLYRNGYRSYYSQSVWPLSSFRHQSHQFTTL